MYHCQNITIDKTLNNQLVLTVKIFQQSKTLHQSLVYNTQIPYNSQKLTTVKILQQSKPYNSLNAIAVKPYKIKNFTTVKTYQQLKLYNL